MLNQKTFRTPSSGFAFLEKLTEARASTHFIAISNPGAH